MKVNTDTLENRVLDYAVGKAEALRGLKQPFNHDDLSYPVFPSPSFRPSTDRHQCGIITEREKISVISPKIYRIGKERHSFPANNWRAMHQYDENELAIHARGESPMEAAMRCYVKKVFGEYVEIPDNLLK